MKKKVLTVLVIAVIAIVGVCAINALQTREKTAEVLIVEKPAVIITYTDRYKNADGNLVVVNGVKNQSESTIKSIKLELQQFDNLANVIERKYYIVELNLLPGESTTISSEFEELEENKGKLISPIIREVIVEE